MTLWDALADPILPIFAVIAVGFLLGRTGQMTLAEAGTVNRLAINVLVPVLVFDLLATAPFETFSPLGLGAYVLVEACVYCGLFVVLRRLFAVPAAEAVLLAWCGIFANNVYVGLPISELLFGAGALGPITSVVTVDSVLTMPFLMIALQTLTHGDPRPLAVILSVARMPMIMALVAGLVFSLAGLTLPAPAWTFVGFAGAAAAPVALIAMGVVLSQTRMTLAPAVGVVALVKTALFPALVLALAAAGGAQAGLFAMAAAGPSGATAINLALHFKVATARIAQVVIWTTLAALMSYAVIAAGLKA